MKQINHKDLKELIKKAYDTKTPLFIHGAMGVGKSSVVRDVATDMGIELVDVRVSQLEPSDLRGLPKVDGEVTRWLISNWLPRDKNSKGIIFLDELNLAPPSIQASCYQLILDRRLGDYELPEGWFIVSAGNRIEDKANIFEMSAPLSNRFIHVELSVPSVEDWTKWATTNRSIDGRIIAFLTWKSIRLFSFDSKNKDKAFGTPRSWEYCSKLIMNEDYNKNPHFVETLIASSVGEAIAVEFTAFLKLTQKIKVEDILKNPKQLKNIQEISLKYSLISSVSEYFRNHKNKETLESIFKVCQELEAEFGMLLLRLVKSTDESAFNQLCNKSGLYKDISKEYGKYLI